MERKVCIVYDLQLRGEECLNQDVLIENVTINLLRLAETKLPLDVKQSLENAYEKERSIIGRKQLEAILENIKIAEKKGIPICQDTGLINFYLEAGTKFQNLANIEKTLRRAVRKATVEIPLRPNALHPLTQKNTTDNTGEHVPYVHWKIVNNDSLKITAFPKGGGSENVCTLKMMNPGDGLNGLKKYVVETVVKAGGLPCPPTIIGVGVGGGADIAMELAKIVLIKPINHSNSNKVVAKLEKELYTAVNETGIGPMGLGGDTTALAVKVEYAHRHPASYPIAIAFQCWAARRATACIGREGDVEYLSHDSQDLLKFNI